MVKTWQVVLATIGIFLAGLITGAASAFGVVRWIVHHPRVFPPGIALFNPRMGLPQQITPQLMRNFANQLGLTQEQREQIMPIVHGTAAQLGRARHEVQLESVLAIEKMQDQIAALLTPEQKVKFEELISKQRARLQQFRASRFEEAK
ncbi:MAG TPA: hypothetical protein VGG34_06985 [Opitutaceae bacterium]|jgi:Spy/CpxP family protein refolding chaperone